MRKYAKCLVLVVNDTQSFNVAASIKMRKSTLMLEGLARRRLLQCGRIYKDAEIGIWTYGGQHDYHVLQCGRIYKDAEMKDASTGFRSAGIASMWPHL